MQTRRDFLQSAGLGAAALGLGGAGSLLVPATTLAAPAKRAAGRVVTIADEGMTKDGKPVAEVVQKMLARAMQELTGKKKLADAWASLFSAKDKVGIKINTLGRPLMVTTQQMIDAIVAGLKDAGLPEEQLIVFDLSPSQMKAAGYKLRPTAKKGVRYLAFRASGFADKEVTHPSGKVKFGKAFLEVDKIINVPVIKDHDNSGVTCALKNMAFGCINNPEAHHRGHCDPGIANIYNLAPIKDRTVLTICDASFLQYDGGPQFKPAARVAHNTVYVTHDPVALDTLVWDEVDKRRKDKGMKTLEQAKRAPKHIATAAQLGLGTDDRAKIKVAKVKL